MQVVDHLLTGPAAGSDTTDWCDLRAESQDRLDFQRRSQKGLCRSDAAPAPQVLEGVEAEPHLEPLTGLADRVGHLVQRHALLGGAGCSNDQAAESSGAR